MQNMKSMKVHSMKWIGNWAAITTLFLDRHNDNIQIYILPQGKDKYRLTDDGWTINDRGFDFNTLEEKVLIENTLSICDAKLRGHAIEVMADGEALPHKVNSLLLAIFAVNAMFDYGQIKVAEVPDQS